MKITRRLIIIIVMVSMLLVPALLLPSVAVACEGCDSGSELDYVDIGDPDSEAGHSLIGWGPVEPETSGGNYGGIDDCRVTWEAGDADRIRYRAASFVMKMPRGSRATCLKLKVLDGLADDSFKVYVGFRRVYKYNGEQTDSEDWITHEIDLGRRGRHLHNGTCPTG